jgi:hypothetical protein
MARRRGTDKVAMTSVSGQISAGTPNQWYNVHYEDDGTVTMTPVKWVQTKPVTKRTPKVKVSA